MRQNALPQVMIIYYFLYLLAKHIKDCNIYRRLLCQRDWLLDWGDRDRNNHPGGCYPQHNFWLGPYDINRTLSYLG